MIRPHVTCWTVVSDIAIFVLKRDVKLQPTNLLDCHMSHMDVKVMHMYVKNSSECSVVSD